MADLTDGRHRKALARQFQAAKVATLVFSDNRLQGLLREIEEAIAACDDPTTLRRLGVELKLIADAARGKGYELQPKEGNRYW